MNSPEPAERQKRIRQLFEELSDKSTEEQSAALDEVCRDDPDLRKDVEALLKKADLADTHFDRLEHGVIVPTLKTLHEDPVKLSIWLEDSSQENSDIPDAMIGTTVSHFEIHDLIGRGGMGVVYQALDQVLGRTVALKFLPPALIADKSAIERFIHEARAASALEHPNIATIYEINGTDDQQVFIAMGYYPGETLKKKIEKGPISPETALDYTIQLTSALAQAHAKGIVHRDIKPGNMMISEDGKVTLLDFGLATLAGLGGSSSAGLMMGTVSYMSPEQARGESLDGRTDIWSLGVVLYEMLTGKRLFIGEDSESVIRDILERETQEFPIPASSHADIAEDLTKIIGTCLAKNPAERYNNAEALLIDLQRALRGLPPSGQPARLTWIRRLRRNRIRISLTSAAIVIVGIFLILGYRHLVSSRIYLSALDSVLVLPFSNLGDDSEELYFVDGIQDGVITMLSRIPSLKVIARGSTLQYRDNERSPTDDVLEPSAKVILSGSVERTDDRIRISSELTDTSTGQRLWADKNSRRISPANIHAIQADIISGIARTLRVDIPAEVEGHIELQATKDLPALESYYRARAVSIMDFPESRLEAIAHYQQAIELDSNFAPALAGLAAVYEEQIWKEGYPVEQQALMAEPLIEKALGLDDQLPDALVAKGSLEWLKEGYLMAARTSYERAIELNPSHVRAHLLLGRLLLECFDKPTEALDLYQNVIELDPAGFANRLILIKPLQLMGRYDEAQKILEAELDLNPEDANLCQALGSLLHHGKNQCDAAMSWYRKAHALDPANPLTTFMIRGVYERLGDAENARAWAKSTRDIAPESWMANCEKVAEHLQAEEDKRALQYFHASPYEGILHRFVGSAFEVLLDSYLRSGNTKKALALCEREFPELLNPLDEDLQFGYFVPTDDPFSEGQGKVAEIYPGEPHRGFYNVNVTLPLPMEAWIVDPSPRAQKSTLYFKLGRPSVEGIPGKVDVAWGLYASTEFPNIELPSYGEYSIQGRYTESGVIDVFDEDHFTSLLYFALDTDTFYELWFVIDHANNTFDQHLRGGSQFPEQTLVYTSAGYRQKNNNPLDQFLMVSTAGSLDAGRIKGKDPLYLDDLYIDPDSENLNSPDEDWILLDNFEDGDTSNWKVFNADNVRQGMDHTFANNVAMSLWRNDKKEQPDVVLEDIPAVTGTPSYWRYHHLINRIRAHRGERASVLQAIRAQINSGWLWKGMYDRQEFKWLHNDPEFRNLVMEMDAILNAQLANIHGMDANGELSPIPTIPGR